MNIPNMIYRGDINGEQRGPGLADALRQVESRCNSCAKCRESCQLLKLYGTPVNIARTCDPSRSQDAVIPFKCSLCGLCSAACPAQADPRAMMLSMRREAFAAGKGEFPQHSGLVAYEKKGTSRLFTWYGLPPACDTVFFPGCALPGSRPEQTKAVFSMLKCVTPTIGIVLDCCTKPSHDLGRQEYFLAMFGEMKRYLLTHGIKNVLVACPNCHAVFREYAPEIATTTVYEALAGIDGYTHHAASGNVTVHDPCTMRDEPQARSAVRVLAARAGCNVEEMLHHGNRTLCCGEGGAVAALAPDFASAWAELRSGEAADRRVITSCAGCAGFLASHMTVSHVTDLVLDPQAALAGKAPVSRAPFTYLNRLKLKKYFRDTMKTAVSRERTFTAGPRPAFFTGTLLFLRALVTAFVTILPARPGKGTAAADGTEK